MKRAQTNERGENVRTNSVFGNSCRECCEKILAQIRETKRAILAESRILLNVPEQILKLALNEAEALAWQTLYPHLVFPALAAEKVRGVAAWSSRQRLLQIRSRPF